MNQAENFLTFDRSSIPQAALSQFTRHHRASWCLHDDHRTHRHLKQPPGLRRWSSPMIPFLGDPTSFCNKEELRRIEEARPGAEH